MNASTLLYPQPRSFCLTGGSSVFPTRFVVHPIGAEAEQLATRINVRQRCEATAAARPSANFDRDSVTNVTLEFRGNIHPQGYVLEWSPDGLMIAASAETGLHYALVTFNQLAVCERAEWEHFRIEDEPDFPVRGVMLDIGRNKIPKIKTLYALIDQLSELKINHLQLYMEGFSFDYKKYAASFPDATPLTAAEYQDLDAYALSRYIDLVPSQNCLGHMGEWLAKPEFRELAEHPDGMAAPPPLTFKLPPVTLNPVDERSVRLATNLFNDLLPNFSSAYVNINMDEPFGLCTGQSKRQADGAGVGELFLNFAERMFEVVRGQGKKILMWGDVFLHHPELLDRLPGDVTVLHWNYDHPVPFEPPCRTLRDKGVRYYVCPGTSSWNSLSGRTDNMLGNIADAARTGKAYGADGLIVTDWGDGGHWQASTVGYPGIAYAAGASWGTETNLDRLEPMMHHISSRMIHDRNGEAARFLLELGRYYHLERSTLENMTYTNYLMGRGLSEREDLEQEIARMIEISKLVGGSGLPFQLDYRYSEMAEWLQVRQTELEKLDLVGPDAEVLKDELANTLRLIEVGAGLHRYIYRQDLLNKKDEIVWLERLLELLETAIAEFERLWLVRNRKGGLANSRIAFDKLMGQLREYLHELKDGEGSR